MNQQVKDVALVIIEANQLADMLAECDHDPGYVFAEQDLLMAVEASEMGVDRLWATLKALGNKAEYYRELGKELQLKGAAIEARKHAIEDSLLEMVQQDLLPRKLIGTVYRITVCNNSVPSLTLTKEQELELIEAGYVRTKLEVDKKAVVEAIENKELPDFEDTLHRGLHLRLGK
jgi:hypothetical protein